MDVFDNHAVGSLGGVRLLGPLEHQTRVVEGGNRKNALDKHLCHGRPPSFGRQQTHKGAHLIDGGFIKQRLAPNPLAGLFQELETKLANAHDLEGRLGEFSQHLCEMVDLVLSGVDKAPN